MRSGPVDFTSFIHPTAQIRTASFSIGARSLTEGFVSLQGSSAHLGNAANLQDNDRLLDFYSGAHRTAGDLMVGDGSFTAHGVTFVGRVRIGEACGTVISAVVQNASVGDASLTGFTAQIVGKNPYRPIESLRPAWSCSARASAARPTSPLTSSRSPHPSRCSPPT